MSKISKLIPNPMESERRSGRETLYDTWFSFLFLNLNNEILSRFIYEKPILFKFNFLSKCDTFKFDTFAKSQKREKEQIVTLLMNLNSNLIK